MTGNRPGYTLPLPMARFTTSGPSSRLQGGKQHEHPGAQLPDAFGPLPAAAVAARGCASGPTVRLHRVAARRTPDPPPVHRYGHRRALARLHERLPGADGGHSATGNLGVGALLLLAAQAMRAGTFTVGDLSIFVSYIGWLSQITTASGGFLRQYKQAGVSVGRLVALVQGEEAAQVPQRRWWRTGPSTRVRYRPTPTAPGLRATYC